MKTNEEKKIVRVFQMIVIWTLFAAFTVYGLVSAAEKTAFVNEGKETSTIVFAIDNYF